MAEQMILRCVPLLILLAGMAATARAQTTVVLTNIGQIRSLTAEEAERRIPVRVRGVVTFFDPQLYVGFIRDDTGSVYFPPRNFPDGPVARCRAGDLIEIEGITARGRFAPHLIHGASPPRVKVLGHPGLPEARRLAPQDLANPAHHSERIEIVGVVRGYGRERNKLRLDLSTSSGSFRAVLPVLWRTDASPATNWLGAVLRLRGVHGSLFNENRELAGLRVFVAGMDDVTVEDPGEASFAERPIRPVVELLRFHGQTSPRERVAGVVTQFEPGRGLFLQDDTGPLWVQTPQREPLPPGTRVDIVGYPGTRDGQPVLRDGFVRALGPGTAPPAVPVSVAEAFAGEFHGHLVRVQGKVVDRFVQPGNHLLLLNEAGLTYAARLIEPDSTRLLELPERGSVIEVEGVALNEFVPVTGLASDDPVRHQSVSLQVALRTPGDLRVLQPAPYWTTERLQWLAGGVMAVLLLAVAWIALLRRQVARQTALVETKVARETLQEERARLARELHDTLEQELTGISLQLDAASDTLPDSPDTARRALHHAQALLKHTRSEARRSIWDLRASVLENGDLVSALRETLRQFHGGNGTTEIVVTSDGSPRPLPNRLENNLLRIASEAVTNAVKHAAARRIIVHVGFAPDAILLRVEDDGRGFDATTALCLDSGHYGLLGMRERAAKLGGQLTVTSAPDRGTRVEVRVHFPIPVPSSP